MQVAQSRVVPRFADSTSPSAVIDWTYETFAEERVLVTTAFGMEGCVLLDLLAQRDRRLTVHFADTGFLFRETHELQRRLAARYPRLSIVTVTPALSPEQQAAEHGPALWSRDPDRCCALRKVEPLAAVLSQSAAWITAIRRTQSATRASVPLAGWDDRFRLVKVAPLAAWSRQQVLDYVLAHDLPVNPLHFRGYPSIGCTHCTRPVAGAAAEDDSRAGRWADVAKTECGLHTTTAAVR